MFYSSPLTAHWFAPWHDFRALELDPFLDKTKSKDALQPQTGISVNGTRLDLVLEQK